MDKNTAKEQYACRVNRRDFIKLSGSAMVKKYTFNFHRPAAHRYDRRRRLSSFANPST
jgi:hypothetical protein